jgi:hypothetical protein
MSELVSSHLEKIFFTHILQNPRQFYSIDLGYFKNVAIQFIYGIVKEEFIISKSKVVPKPQQILTMVRIKDPNQDMVTNDILKILLKNDNSDHDKEYVETKFKSWKLSNMIRNNVYKTIDEIRGMNDIDIDNVTEVASKLRAMYGDLSVLDDEEDLGQDFDDPESHKQELNLNKIPTGWGSLDHVTDGGWDLASLTVFMGETSIGKCVTHDSKITIKNKINGEIITIPIGDFYEKMKITND